MVPTATKTRLLSALFVIATACNGTNEGFDCERVAPDLANRCEGRRFSVADPGLCAFVYPAGEVVARLDQLTIDLCEVAQPVGNEECYLTEPCDQIAEGKCVENVSATRRIDPDCQEQCEVIDKMCFRTCPGMGTADLCDTCMLDCEQARIDCEAMCPLAP